MSGMRWSVPVLWVWLLACSVWAVSVLAQPQDFVARQGIRSKFLTAKQQLMSNFYQQNKEKTQLNMGLLTLWTQPLDQLYPRGVSQEIPVLMRLGNHTLIVVGLHIWLLEHQRLTRPSVLPFLTPHRVIRVKGIEWQNKLFLLVCLKNNKCILFTSAAAAKAPVLDFYYCQTISDAGHPVDVEFFVQNNQVFLVVLYQAFHCSISQTRLYRWHENSMDLELVPEITSTATSVTVFNHGDTVVMVLGCGADGPIKFPSQVWCRRASGELVKVQHLPTTSPLSITHFVMKGESFLLILEANQRATVYWWEGSEFFQWLSVEGMLTYFKVSASSKVMETTFLVFSKKSSLKVYLMTAKKFENVFETELLIQNEELSILSTIMYEENNKIYLFVQTRGRRRIYMTLFEINISQNPLSEESNSQNQPKQRSQEAINAISETVSVLEVKMNTLDNILSTLLFTNQEATLSGSVAKVSQAVKVESGEIIHLVHTHVNIPGLTQRILSKIYPIREKINTLFDNLKNTKVQEKRHLIYDGNVYIQKAKINAVVADTVNGKPFLPESFLSLTKNQRLSSIKAKMLKAEWLVLTHIGEKAINDLILESSTISIPVRTSRLEVENLLIRENSTINDIMIQELLKNEVVVVPDDSLNQIYKVASGARMMDDLGTGLKIPDDMVIGNLNVETINNIPINELITSLFIKGVTKVIHGNLHFKNGLRTQELKYERVTDVNHLTDIVGSRYDEIHSGINQDSYLSDVRGMFDQGLQIPLQKNPGLQYPPFTNPGLQNSPQVNAGTGLPNSEFIPGFSPQLRQNVHYIMPVPVSGTRSKRLTLVKKPRIIKVKVKIMGDLKVHRIVFKNSSLIVNGTEVPATNLDKIFWTRSTKQVIPGPVHFKKGVSLLEGLDNCIVNGKNLTHFATRNSTFQSLLLENVHINGDVTTGNGNVSSTVGNNKWSSLKVKHLQCESINGKPLHDILDLSHLLKGDLKIIAETLNVGGDLNAGVINDMNLKEKFENAVLINKAAKLHKVVFRDVSAEHIEVKYVNGIAVEKLSSLQDHKPTVRIAGNIHIARFDEVSVVNGKPANLSQVVSSLNSSTIYGRKHFPGQVIAANDLGIVNINGENATDLFENLLRTSTDQVVSGFFNIRRATMSKLTDVEEINDISTTQFVYTDQPLLKLSSDINFASLFVKGNISYSTLLENCNLPKVGEQIEWENAGVWANITVDGDCSWEGPGKHGRLHQLLDSAVTTHANQNITGDVTISLLTSKTVGTHNLNDKNISFIFNDYLSRRKKNQVISGKKYLRDGFRCDSVKVEGDATFSSLNGVNIHSVNSKLVRQNVDDDVQSMPITGHKTFLSGFSAFTLNCKEGINGIAPHNIARDSYPGVLPPLTINDLTVRASLQVESINGLHLESFLQDCVYAKQSSQQLLAGKLTVDGNVVLQGNVTTSSINNITYRDVVFTNDCKRPTIIKGCKTFSSNIQIESDSDIEILNDKNLYQTYNESVKTYQNVTINGSVVLLSKTELNTIYAKEYFVGSKKLTHFNAAAVP